MRETDVNSGGEKDGQRPQPMRRDRGQAAAEHGDDEKVLNVVSMGFGVKQSQA